MGTTDIYVAHQLDDVLETYIFKNKIIGFLRYMDWLLFRIMDFELFDLYYSIQKWNCDNIVMIIPFHMVLMNPI